MPESGLSLPIRGEIIKMLGNRTTRELRHGSFKAIVSRNGSRQVQIPFYGFTEYVGLEFPNVPFL